MKRLTFSTLGQFMVVSLAVLSLLAMGFFAHQFWAEKTPDFANAFTGAAAVLAASVSALVSFRTISIAEESQRPYPYPYIDTQSRYGLSLLKLKNAGGSAAHQVYIEWEGPTPELCQNSDSGDAKPIHFAGDKAHAIAHLMPGESQATPLGVHHWVAEQLKKMDRELKGRVFFQDIKGNQHSVPFFLDTSFIKWSIGDETEMLKAQYALGKIPEALNQIDRSLKQIRDNTQR